MSCTACGDSSENNTKVPSMYEMAKAYSEQKEYFSYGSSPTVIMGMNAAAFYTLFFFSLVVWIIALVLLIRNWNRLPDWAKVLGVLGVLPFLPAGPILTIVVVLLAR